MDFLKEQFKVQMLQVLIDTYGRPSVKVDGQDIHTKYASALCADTTENYTIKDFKALENGCETWLEGHQYPMRFVYQTDKMEILAKIKRLIPTMLKSLNRHKIISSLYLFTHWREYAEYMDFALSDVKADVKFYNQPTRELYYVLSNRGYDELRNILCAIIEYDSAYRYRFQNMIVEVNKYEFEMRPIREIKRLIKIYLKREAVHGNLIVRKFGKVLPLLLMFLWLCPGLKKELKFIVRSIDTNEVKSSPEDLYWQSKDKFYVYKG